MSNILVAGGYRSGSNHIAESLSRYLRSHRTYIAGNLQGYGMDPQRLDHVTMDCLFTHFNGMVYLGHLQATYANVGLIKAFDPHVIVIGRKLFPELHSIRRFEDSLLAWGNKVRHVNPYWGEMDNDQKWRWIAVNVIPWTYNFHVTWRMAKGFRKYITSYEEHFADEVASGTKMCEFLGVKADPGALHMAFDHKDANYSHDRTEYPMPDFVRDMAYDAAKGYGPWEQTIVEDLLDA